MKPDLVLIASASQARLFARHSADADLQLLASFTHPEGRLKAGALGDDRPGHGSSDDRPGGVSFTPREDLHKKERVHPARELSDRSMSRCARDIRQGRGRAGCLLGE
jgi:hypothetical protein